MKTNLLLLFSAIIAVSCQSNSMDNMVYVKGGGGLSAEQLPQMPTLTKTM